MRPIFLSLAVILCSSSWYAIAPALAESASATVVTLNNFKFSPKRVTINRNSIVKWVHAQNGVLHDIDSDDHTSFASPDLRKGDVFRHRFKTAGRFPYHCTFHGAAGGVGMSGVVIVK